MISEANIDKLALKLSDSTDGDGVEILEIASLALQDVNYHPEAKILHKMAKTLANNAGAEFELIEIWLKMPEYLKKVYDFFKTSNTAKDVLIGAVSFIAGGYILNKIVKRDEDEDDE